MGNATKLAGAGVYDEATNNLHDVREIDLLELNSDNNADASQGNNYPLIKRELVKEHVETTQRQFSDNSDE